MSAGPLIGLAIIAVALALFISPVKAARRRGTDGIWIVRLLTALALVTGGLTWILAWCWVLSHPRHDTPQAPRRAGARY